MSQDTISEDATKEEVESYAEQIASEVEDERKGKGDAQIVSEHAGNERKPAAENSGDDTADDESETLSHSDDGEDTGKDEPDWREEAAAEAAAYGISDEEIAEFQSREELDRALKLFDRQIDAERKKLASEGAEDKKGKTPQGEDPPKPLAAEDGRYEVRLDPDIYDEEIVSEFTQLRDYYESRLDALEERFSAADAIAAEQEFDRSVDSLEFSQLFGKTGEESQDELNRRHDLFEHVRIEQDVMARLGRKVEYSSLVQRVARANFPEEFEKRLLKNHTRKISRQTDKRQGGGATRPTDPPDNPRDEADRLYREMEGV